MLCISLILLYWNATEWDSLYYKIIENCRKTQAFHTQWILPYHRIYDQTSVFRPVFILPCALAKTCQYKMFCFLPSLFLSLKQCFKKVIILYSCGYPRMILKTVLTNVVPAFLCIPLQQFLHFIYVDLLCCLRQGSFFLYRSEQLLTEGKSQSSITLQLKGRQQSC